MTTAPPRPRSRQRAPLANLSLGHTADSNVPIAIKTTAPLNIKSRQRLSMKPEPLFNRDAMADVACQVLIKESPNELKNILSVPPRRRVSASAAESLSVPVVHRTVSAPIVFREPGNSLQTDTPKPAPPDVAGQVASIGQTLSSHTTTLASLHTTVTDIKTTQVCPEDVVGGIKMVIEHFERGRNEDRKWMLETLQDRIGELAVDVVELFTAQNKKIDELKHEVRALGAEREQNMMDAAQRCNLLASTAARIEHLETFFIEENKSLAKENAHLAAQVDEAKAEIAQLRQELTKGPDTDQDENDTEDAPKVAASCPSTPRKPAKARAPSLPHTPVLPGMYPRGASLRREAMENSLQRAIAAGPLAPHIPAIVPQSPFNLRFKSADAY